MVRLTRNVSDSIRRFKPTFLKANVVHGFKRGGKELGIPTGEGCKVNKLFLVLGGA